MKYIWSNLMERTEELDIKNEEQREQIQQHIQNTTHRTEAEYMEPNHNTQQPRDSGQRAQRLERAGNRGEGWFNSRQDYEARFGTG